jgi:hypothetical protein
MDANAGQWKIYATDELEITLPGTFIGGNPKKWKKQLEYAVRGLPPQWQPALNTYFKKKQFPFLAADTVFTEGQELFTSCVINYDKLMVFNMPLQQYMNALLNAPGGMEIVETGYVNLSRYPAIRIMNVTRKMPDTRNFGQALKMGYQSGMGVVNKSWEINGKQVMYTVVLAKKAWHIIFGCPVSRFEALLPVFEQCANTFVIKKV